MPHEQIYRLYNSYCIICCMMITSLGRFKSFHKCISSALINMWCDYRQQIGTDLMHLNKNSREKIIVKFYCDQSAKQAILIWNDFSVINFYTIICYFVMVSSPILFLYGMALIRKLLKLFMAGYEKKRGQCYEKSNHTCTRGNQFCKLLKSEV